VWLNGLLSISVSIGNDCQKKLGVEREGGGFTYSCGLSSGLHGTVSVLI